MNDQGDDDFELDEEAFTTVIDAISRMGTFSSQQEPNELREAVIRGNRNAALQLIEQDACPFHQNAWNRLSPDDRTAFHAASERHDLEMMIDMVAKPGTPWTQRFLLCRNAQVTVPCQGREAVTTASSCTGCFFFGGYGLSLEGLEIMLAYGYKIKQRDIEGICGQLAFVPDRLQMLLLCFAASMKDGELQFKLEQCLGLAVGGEHRSFVNGRHPPSLELARILLSAGADPNGYCFQGNTLYDFCPALYQAIKNRDIDMVKLLVRYGADTSKAYQESSYDDDGELDVETRSIESLATEANMSELIQPPEDPVQANPKAFISATRRELVQPLLPAIRELSGIMSVAFSRATKRPPPPGFMTKAVLASGPLGFDLWEIAYKQ